MTGYLSKPAGLGLLTRWLYSCLIGSQPPNITTIIFEQIVKRFLSNRRQRDQQAAADNSYNPPFTSLVLNPSAITINPNKHSQGFCKTFVFYLCSFNFEEINFDLSALRFEFYSLIFTAEVFVFASTLPTELQVRRLGRNRTADILFIQIWFSRPIHIFLLAEGCRFLYCFTWVCICKRHMNCSLGFSVNSG